MSWRSRLEQLRFKYVPVLATWLLKASTQQGRRLLQKSGRIKVLVDNTVLSHGVTHETAWISTGTQMWGPHEIKTGYTARIPVRSGNDDSRESRCIKYLGGITYLAKIGLIELKTSAELLDEQFRQPTGRFRGYGYMDYSIFSDVAIDSVDGYAGPTLGPSYLKLPTVREQQKARIDRASDELHKSLIAALGPKNSQDAWHIRTAELSGCYCFLTMDYRLRDAIESQRGNSAIKGLRTRVMTPFEFGREMKLMPVSPIVFSYTNADFFVRADVSWPDGVRRGGRFRKKQ